MDESIKCANCNKELNTEMEIEYSGFYTELFCGPDCATNYYFEYAASRPLDIDSSSDLESNKFEVKDGKIYHI